MNSLKAFVDPYFAPVTPSTELGLEQLHGDLLSLRYQESELGRLQGVGKSLATLATAMESIQAASAVEIQLINAALQSSLAGTGLQVEDVYPSLEACTGTQVSNESVLVTLKRIWVAFWEGLKRFFSSVVTIYQQIVNGVPAVRRGLSELERALAVLVRAERAPTDAKTLLGEAAPMVMIGNATPTDFAQLQQQYRLLSDLWDLVGEQWIDSAHTAGQRFMTVLESTEASGVMDAVKVTNNIAKELQDSSFRRLFTKAPAALSVSQLLGVQASPGTRSAKSAAVLGNKVLHVQSGRAALRGAIGEAEAYQQFQLTIVDGDASVTAHRMVDTALMATPTVEEMQLMIRDLHRLLSRVESHLSGNRQRQLKRWFDHLGGTMDQLVEAYEADSPTAAHGAMRDDLNALIGYVGAFNQWVTGAQVDLATHVVRVSRAIGQICRQALENYK